MPNSVVRCRTKAWLSEFLFTRGVFAGPDGTPLYLYNAVQEEYTELVAALRATAVERSHPLHARSWAASFCFFVAEKYRREYGAGDTGWSWQPFDSVLGISLSPQERSEIVTNGLAYWQRPVQSRERGNDYLGSLFDEGGLPWKLLQSDTHAFGRSVRACLKKYFVLRGTNSDLIDLVREYEQGFPRAFRTTEKYRLIASIVEWLMGLASSHTLATKSDPAQYLDEVDKEWRKGSPLPVEENNARALVNEWLQDAGRSKQEQSEAAQDARTLTCSHTLTGSLPDWAINTEVYLPSHISFPINLGQLRTTRFEIGFFEGNSLVARSGAAYGRLQDDGLAIDVAISTRRAIISRKKIELPLTLRLLNNGQTVHSEYFENSELDYLALPLIFADDESGEPQLIATESISVVADSVLIRVPDGMRLECDISPEIKGFDDEKGTWIRTVDTTALFRADLRINVDFSEDKNDSRPLFKGTLSHYDTLPSLAFAGWPRLEFPLGAEHAVGVSAKVGKRSLRQVASVCNVGTHEMLVIGVKGETILRRRFGLLPQDFRFTVVPSSANAPAKIEIHCTTALHIAIRYGASFTEADTSDENHSVLLHLGKGEAMPTSLELDLTDVGKTYDPVTVRAPFPNVGVQLFNAESQHVQRNKIRMDELLGIYAVFTPGSPFVERCRLVLELNCHDTQRLSRHYTIQAHGKPASISLFALMDDLGHLLSASPSQDATVELWFETDRVLKRLNIARYDAHVSKLDAHGVFQVLSHGGSLRSQHANIHGMRLDDPQATPVAINERMSQGVGVGIYEIPERMKAAGPWLIFSAAYSPTRFRPVVWAPSHQPNDERQSSSTSLQTAAKLFHPVSNPNSFSRAITRMAVDITHSGWGYLSAQRENFGHLPLSAFESWKALVENEAALATAVFRLELDDLFCKRLSTELSVVWEQVTMASWLSARRNYRALLQGIPDSAIEKLVENRQNSVAASIPCFRHLANYLSHDGSQPPRQLPLPLLAPWYQDLRRRHADDEWWPNDIAAELRFWIDKQDLPAEVAQLADVPFAQSAAFLPIFMAHMTAGQASLSDLTHNLPKLRFAIRVITDFDREAWYEPAYSLVLTHLLAKS